MRTESKELLELLFDPEERQVIQSFADLFSLEYFDHDGFRNIWKFDQKIGGLGGYATPTDCTINPFNTLGKYRNVFRSLQYAKNDLMRGDRPRHLILDAGLHVETLIKLLVEEKIVFLYSLNKKMLGKNIENLFRHNAISLLLYNCLMYYKEILNIAKHDYDSENDRTFDYLDAVIFYFTTRKIGNEILKILHHHSLNNCYEVMN